MSTTVTETAIPLCCAMCLTVPEDPAALHNFGREDLPYWLCVDRYACLDRAVAAQRGTTEETSAPGTEPATPAPAVPPAGEGAGKLALPGAEDDEQDAQEPPQEELPLEPLPEPVDEGAQS